MKKEKSTLGEVIKWSGGVILVPSGKLKHAYVILVFVEDVIFIHHSHN
jgi:hypothetical protein